MVLRLNPETLSELEKMADQYDVDANRLLENALKAYRRQLEEEKSKLEKQHFLSQHAKLKEAYLGHFIAMDHGQVVDHDLSFETLHQRIRQQFGRQAILIRRVEVEPDRPLMIRSPKFRWSSPSEDPLS